MNGNSEPGDIEAKGSNVQVEVSWDEVKEVDVNKV